MKKNVLFAGMSGIVLAFVLAISGCASFAFLRLLGTLTITGIPAEYEGGTVTLAFALGSGTISNGSVSMVIQNAVDKTGATNLALNVTRAGIPSAGIFFQSVRFENQTAAVRWDDGAKTGLLNVTGVPAAYNRDDERHTGSVVVLAGKELRRGGALALFGGYTGNEAGSQGWVVDGTVSIPLWAPVDGLPAPFAESTEMRVLLDIAVGRVSDGAAVVAATEGFLFESVRFTNGNADISFSRGTKRQ
jgi:hypothetical protein